MLKLANDYIAEDILLASINCPGLILVKQYVMQMKNMLHTYLYIAVTTGGAGLRRDWLCCILEAVGLYKSFYRGKQTSWSITLQHIHCIRR